VNNIFKGTFEQKITLRYLALQYLFITLDPNHDKPLYFLCMAHSIAISEMQDEKPVNLRNNFPEE
jgi:hypothetical protein